MGYFSNGCEGMDYEAEYCARCVHGGGETFCAVWEAHLFANYQECNNPESVLHMLIPRGERGGNLQCRMFWARGTGGSGQPEPKPAEQVRVMARSKVAA